MKKKKNRWVFYPVRARVSLVTGIYFYIDYIAKDFLTFAYHDPFGDSKIFTYFYDKRDGNRWRSSGKTALSWPETHPHPKTVTAILFRQEEPHAGNFFR